jgi:hypothetical protein
VNVKSHNGSKCLTISSEYDRAFFCTSFWVGLPHHVPIGSSQFHFFEHLGQLERMTLIIHAAAYLALIATMAVAQPLPRVASSAPSGRPSFSPHAVPVAVSLMLVLSPTMPMVPIRTPITTAPVQSPVNIDSGEGYKLDGESSKYERSGSPASGKRGTGKDGREQYGSKRSHKSKGSKGQMMKRG